MARPKGSKDSKPRTRKVSAATSKAMDQASADMSNGINGAALKTAVSEWEAEQKKIDRLTDECKDAVAPYRERQKYILETAKARGVPLRALKTKLKIRRIEGKLDADDRDLVQQLGLLLGDFVDLPLGQAAVNAAERGARALASLAEDNRTSVTFSTPDSTVTITAEDAARIVENIDRMIGPGGITQLDSPADA